jgi:peptidase M28-like protein
MTPSPAPRLRLLTLLAFAALSAACGSGGGTQPDAADQTADWPQQPLPEADAQQVDPQQFLSTDQLRAWQVDLDHRGLRATGTPAHEGYIDALYARLKEAGVNELRYEEVPMTRWSVEQWGLELVGGADAGKLETASYIPYSGSTPAEGVSAPLVYLAPKTAPDASMAGKIVVFDVPTPAVPMGLFLAKTLAAYDPGHAESPATPYQRPVFGMGVPATVLDLLGRIGAAGAVGVLDESAATAHGSYFPYDHLLRKVPGVYVDRDTGRRLKAQAAAGAQARLLLPAKVEQVQTRNIVGIIPGASDELTVINSHTDGTNGIEDNGPNAIIAMAQYLARLPRSALPRSVMILLTSGHFASGVGADGFLEAHRGDGLLQRIASILTVEHMGAEEWLPDADGNLAATGRPEFAGLFEPRIAPLIDASARALKRADAAPAYVIAPLSPKPPVWPGEGQYFWAGASIPTANYITGPYYLLNWGVSTADKVDYERMRRETVAFTQMLLELSRVPAEDLRKVEPAS